MESTYANLVDVSRISPYNKGFKYLLTCIDVLSRYSWVIPLKDKTRKTLVAAFATIFESGQRPVHLQTDKGTEFTNRVFQKFLRENDVHFFTTQNVLQDLVESYNITPHRTIGLPRQKSRGPTKRRYPKDCTAEVDPQRNVDSSQGIECDSVKPRERSTGRKNCSL